MYFLPPTFLRWRWLERIRKFFVGPLLMHDLDVLHRANVHLIFYIVAYCIAFLLILQGVYVYYSNWFQFFKGAIVISIFLGALFAIRWTRTIKPVTHFLVIVSLLNILLNCYLFREVTFFNGLNIMCNLIVAFHVLGRVVGFYYGLIHLILVGAFFIGYHVNYFKHAEIVLQQTLVEKLTVFALLILFISLVLFYYHRAYEISSRALKRSLKEFQKAKEKAESMNRLKSNFLSSMSHEIRTPLNGILGVNQVLRTEINDPELQELINVQLQSGERLLKTIESILSISKIESEHAYFDPKWINIVPLVDEVHLSLSMVAINKGLDFHCELPLDPVYCFVDESMFFQVLNNIIGNAIKFTSEGSIRIFFSIELANQSMMLHVQDTGIGISDDYRESVFEPFVQESFGLNRRFEGSGLGLSISKRYIEMMGGEIGFSSVHGQGTEFFIKLPTQPEKR